MVDATVSMLLQRLAPMIENKVREEACMLINFNSNNETKNLFSKLKIIQQLLQDAERKRVMDPKVKSWLQKFQDISYEIEDVLDEEDLRNFNLKFEESEDIARSSFDSWKKVSSFLESLCLYFKQVVERQRILRKFSKINKRLNSIAEENEDEFKFIPNVSRDSHDFKRVVSTSFVDVSEVRGRDYETSILVSKLLGENGNGGSENGIKILSIVGAGGIGKTTLAQFAFNDKRVKNHFQHKIWVCVSHPFDEIKICKAILESLNKITPNLSQFETLLQCIKTAISGKKVLLVLDDVWTDDDTMWKPLKIALANCSSSSRILVTTRKGNVAEIMGSTSSEIQQVHPLSDSDCWLLLSQRAFSERTGEESEVLKRIGREIVKKCKGLPLAAKIVGSLLHYKRSVKEWENVLEIALWEQRERNEVFYQNAHHLNICEPDASMSAVSICHPEKLRSLLCTKKIPQDLIGRLKRVRSLSLQNCDLQEMQSEICNLIHLRCLDLSCNPIQELPEEICYLYKLQTLGVEFCHNLKGLPKGIHRLKKLRHLLNLETPSKFEFLRGFEELTDLQTLNQFYVTKECNNLVILKNSNQLQGSLRICITGLDEEDHIVEAEKANLKDKKFLSEFQLHCAGKIKFEVIEALQPPPNLQILEFAGLYLPKWITTLTNVRKLTIKSNKFANLAVYREMGGFTSLPPLGKLPFLEQLNLEDMCGMGKLGNEFLGTNVPGLGAVFPKLKRLSLMWCTELTEWEDISKEEEDNTEKLIMPSLEHLLVLDCMELEALPHRLLRKASSLEYLNIMGSTHLLERYDREGGEDWDKVSHIPQVSTSDFWNADPNIRL
ncbi:hypothetical protein BUALT_Bualt10G0114700 [Buddleja alternifolia]|uniref:Uncharacterized protein n=1 Tax=Buddleja alternifolia TaxID=168488 RepID=A0AAV6X635_9LAMI|nr:hypothetical protein BUALT_Bualt10G0114700 [Buddleja alternifolia]